MRTEISHLLLKILHDIRNRSLEAVNKDCSGTPDNLIIAEEKVLSKGCGTFIESPGPHLCTETMEAFSRHCCKVRRLWEVCWLGEVGLLVARQS